MIKQHPGCRSVKIKTNHITTDIDSPASIIRFRKSLFPSTMKYEDYDYSNSQASYNDLAIKCGVPSPDLQRWVKIRKLRQNCKVHKLITDYVGNSTNPGQSIRIETIYKIQRTDERDPFDDRFRILLWYGTKPSSIAGILQTGFRKGAVGELRAGVYFADRVSKSVDFVGKTPSGTGYFVLAEVAPGRIYKARQGHADYGGPPTGFDSVKGMGRQIPTWKENKHYYGAIVPSGVTTQNQRHAQYDRDFSEYIIYDPERIIVRFIVECTF